MLPLAVFEKLPKTDLHVHLDGSLRSETLLELAERNGVKLPADTPGVAPVVSQPLLTDTPTAPAP